MKKMFKIAQLLLLVFVLLASCGGKAWKEGDNVHVKWNENWYQASILSVESDGKYKIHYTGWADSWDEVVAADRIRNTDEGTALPVPTTTNNETTTASAKGRVVSEGEVPAFDASLTYSAGDAVWVKWNSSWYESSITEVKENNSYKIHYTGWSDSYDEVKPNNEIRPMN